MKTASKSAEIRRNNHHAHIAAHFVLVIPYWGTLGASAAPIGMMLTSNTAGPLPEAAFLACLKIKRQSCAADFFVPITRAKAAIFLR